MIFNSHLQESFSTYPRGVFQDRDFITSQSCFCFVWMTCFSWCLQVMTFNANWSVSQLIVKQLGLESTPFKYEAMVLSQKKKVKWSFHVGNNSLLQTEEIKYLGILFTSNGRMAWDGLTDQVLIFSNKGVTSMVKSKKAKPSIYYFFYFPTLT